MTRRPSLRSNDRRMMAELYVFGPMMARTASDESRFARLIAGGMVEKVAGSAKVFRLTAKGVATVNAEKGIQSAPPSDPIAEDRAKLDRGLGLVAVA